MMMMMMMMNLALLLLAVDTASAWTTGTPFLRSARSITRIEAVSDNVCVSLPPVALKLLSIYTRALAFFLANGTTSNLGLTPCDLFFSNPMCSKLESSLVHLLEARKRSLTSFTKRSARKLLPNQKTLKRSTMWRQHFRHTTLSLSELPPGTLEPMWNEVELDGTSSITPRCPRCKRL